ncbi:MAG: beta-lactamase family protein [Treponema sp.]|nr:beta-lactamase family protein [Treponema sp.]
MDDIKEFLTNCVKKGAFPGGNYIIGNPDAILEQGSFGTMDGSKTVDMNTIYDLASLTKTVTSIATMRMLQQGLLCMEDTIGVFLPENDKSDVMLYELMTHTSRIQGAEKLYRKCDTKEKMIESLLSMPPRDTKAVPVEYSCAGYIILGAILEAIAGRGLDEVFKTLVLDPLGMENTMFNPPDSIHERIAPTEFCQWRNCIIKGRVHDENAVVMGGISGNAGLFGTAPDIAKIAKMMLTGKDEKGRDFLSPAIIKEMTRDHTIGLNLSRGLGWQVKRGPGTPMGDLYSNGSFGHTGFTGTSFYIDPERKLYAVLLTNRVHPTRENEKIFRVRKIFHNLVILQYGK